VSGVIWNDSDYEVSYLIELNKAKISLKVKVGDY